jgi:flagellar motor protein MotB
MQVGLEYGSIFHGELLNFKTTGGAAPVAPILLNPTITWPTPGNQVGPYNLTPTQLNAICSIPGSTLNYSPALGSTLQPGTYTLSVTCTPPGNSGYGPLTTTVPFMVTRPQGNIVWPTPTPVEGPARLTPTELNATCSIPGGTLSYSPALGSVMNIGTHILHVTCTPPAGSPYLPINGTVELIVKEKTSPVITLDPPVNPTAQITNSQFSTISWEKSPNGIAYFITLDGSRICTTAALTCTVKKLVGPHSDLKIYATKGELTSSYVVPKIVRGTKPQVIGIIYFDSAKYNIRADQKPEIARVAGLLQTLGYTNIVIGGHTDSNSYDNITLSNNRATSTKSALSKLVSGLKFDLHYSGATEPMASNATVSGQAKNRRAEIAVW